MLILGIQGSPRKNGNTFELLSAFMAEAAGLGARTQVIEAGQLDITPCRELKVCERKGFCPLQDDMESSVFPLLWQADLIVMATPVFFYSVPAQLKALIDRAQTLWARKYCLKLEDPGRKWRSGFVLAAGATRGENLFQGLNLTAKYFFDAIGASFKGSLGYRRIENVGDMAAHPTALAEVREKARELVMPWLDRRKVLFVSEADTCRSQMAQAFMRYHAGSQIEAASAGVHPAGKVNPMMAQVMAEKGIDMAFRYPTPLQSLVGTFDPDLVVSMAGPSPWSPFPAEMELDWDLPAPSGQSIDDLRSLRDEIDRRVRAMASTP